MKALHRSREAEQHKRRWQMLGLLLLALAAALYWADRRMTGRAGGHLGDWITPPTSRPDSQGTAPAGAQPMPGSTDGPGAEAEATGAFGVRAEAATAAATEPAAETVTVAPPAMVEEPGDAPEPEAWQDALEGQAPAGEETTATTGVAAAAPAKPATRRRSNVRPSTATGWVEGDGTNVCPEGFPIKGNANSHIYHLPGQSSYEVTIAEICFATEAAAAEAGYRPRKR
jgi:hypothetical protein